MAASTVRPIRDDEFGTAFDIARMAMLRGPASEEETAAVRPLVDTTRMVAGFDDDGRMCAASRAFSSRLTVPGGEVDAGALSSVGVLPTHRRQGYLTRMMRALFDDSVDRGEPVQVLIAAEYPIYGRFGFGVATEACQLRLDAAARWRSEPTGSVELVDGETFAKSMEQLYDRVLPETTGHMDFLDIATVEWRTYAGVDPLHDGRDDERRNAPKVVWRDGHGEIQAGTAYSLTQAGADNRPASLL